MKRLKKIIDKLNCTDPFFLRWEIPVFAILLVLFILEFCFICSSK